MGFKDLAILKEKKLYLVLVIWLLVSFSVLQFVPDWGMILFIPLLAVSAILFILSFVFRQELTELSFKKILLYLIIAIPLILIFTYFAVAIFFVLFIISIFSYVFITSLFSMVGCYEKGIEWDEKLFNMPKPISTFSRLGEFYGGSLIGIILMIFFALVGTTWAAVSPEVADTFIAVPWIIVVSIIVISVIGSLTILRGHLNAWLGTFFIWVSIYSFYLMLKAFYSLGSTGGGSEYSFEVQILLYIFDLILILVTIGSLLGRSEWLTDKLKIIKPDAIIIWLIFSKAAYELADTMGELDVSLLKAVGVFVLFVPLFIIIGIYGILKYGKLKKQRKIQKKQKKKSLSVKKYVGKGKHLSDDDLGSTDIIKCKKCSTENKISSKFCSKCGGPL